MRIRDTGFWLILGLAASALGGVWITSYGMYRFARRNLDADLDRRILLAAEEGARVVAEAWAAGGLPHALQPRLESVRRASQLENLLVFDLDRRALADARPRVSPGKLYTYLQLPPGIDAAIRRGENLLDRGRRTEAFAFRSAAVPLWIDGEIHGGVYAQASVDFEDALSTLRTRWILATGFSIGACLLLVSVLVWLIQRNHRMREAVQRRSRLELVHRLSAGIAHDVKGPLATMRSAAERLEQELGGHPQARTHIVALHKGTERIRETVDHMLGTGRGMEPQCVGLQSLVREVVGEAMPVALAKGVRIENAWAEDTAVIAPATPLRMSIANVLHNAVDAVPERTGRVHLSCRLRRSAVGVAVSDNGPGIPAPLLRRVFDPLVTTKPDGSGLGLPVTRQLMEDMKGSVEVESEPGTGTTVVLWMPTKEPKPNA